MENVAVLPLSASWSTAVADHPELSLPGRTSFSAGNGSQNGHGSSPRPSLVPFYAGPENQLLVEALRPLLVTLPSPYNPLVLAGPPGIGKTHLARGLAQSWREQARLVYTTASDFAREFAASLEDDSAADFRRLHRSARLLIVEDLSQLAAKKAAQQELLHTIDAVQSNDGQLVLTSRLPPDKINGLPPALVSRLIGGLVVSISPPGPAVRLAILEQYVTVRGLDVPSSALRLLADGLDGAAPELFGALNELYLEASLAHEPLSLERVRKFLFSRRGAVRLSVRSIASSSAKYFGIRLNELTSPTRRRSVVQARAIAIFLARQLADKSLEQLGEYFGGRDHTTVLHSYRTIEERLRTDPGTRRAVADIRKMLAHV